MKMLDKNKQTIYYALLVENGERENGDPNLSYSDPVSFSCYVTAGRSYGTYNATLYGGDETIDKYILTEQMNCPISGDTQLWIDIATTEKPNYIVCGAPRKSLNSITYAIKKI